MGIYTPIWVFIRLFFACGILVFIINLIRKILDKTKISYTLFALLPAFFGSIVFMMLWLSETTISFAIFDPKYYTFQNLCQESGLHVYDKDLYQQITKQEKLYNELSRSFDNNSALKQEFELNKEQYMRQFSPKSFSEDARLYHAKEVFLNNKASEMAPLQLHNGEKWSNDTGREGDTKLSAIEDRIYESKEVIYAYCVDNPLDSCPTDKKHIIALQKDYIYYYPQFQLKMTTNFDPEVRTKGSMRCQNTNALHIED